MDTHSRGRSYFAWMGRAAAIWVLLAGLFAACDDGPQTTSDKNPITVSSSKAIVEFALYQSPSASEALGQAVIDESAKRIEASLPAGTDVRSLVAKFVTTGKRVEVAGVKQVSGKTANDFSKPLRFVVFAADGSKATYTVSVAVMPQLSSDKAITAYALYRTSTDLEALAVGTIDEAAKTIDLSVPFETEISALIARFETTAARVEANGVEQVSGVTPNDFAAPVEYVAFAEDGSSTTYTVTVALKPPLADTKAITSFALFAYATSTDPLAQGLIDEANKTITLTLPPDTNVTALVAGFETTGAKVEVAGVLQVSGVTANDFTNPVTYVVTAWNNTQATYTVKVTVRVIEPPDEPEILSTYPAANATGVPGNAKVTITFSEPMDGASFTSSTFYVRNSDGMKEPGTITTSGATVSFTPSTPFNLGSTYGATVEGSVKALNGLMLDHKYTWTFTMQMPVQRRTLDLRNDPGSTFTNTFGRVIDDSGQIDCGVVNTKCQGTYDVGTEVKLTAIPLDGFVFLKWTWDDCGRGTGNPVTITIDASKNYFTCGADWSAEEGRSFKFNVTYGAWIARIKENKGDWEYLAINCGPEVNPSRCQAEYYPSQDMMFRAIADPNAPAGNFRWACTNRNPYSNETEYHTGEVLTLRFYRDMDCNVMWIPNPP